MVYNNQVGFFIFVPTLMLLQEPSLGAVVFVIIKKSLRKGHLERFTEPPLSKVVLFLSYPH